MTVKTATQPLNRADIATFSKSEKVTRFFENLGKDVSATLPGASNANEDEIAAAAQDAANAMTAAQAAQTSADDANALGAALQLPQYLMLAGDPILSNERVLSLDPISFDVTDGGPGFALTVALTEQRVMLSADVANATTTFADADNLAVILAANTAYMVEGLLTFQSAATSTGIGLCFNLPAGASISGCYSHNVTANTVEGAFNTGGGTVSGNTSGAPLANSNIPIMGRWLIATGATAGVAQLQFRSEVGGSAVTIKAGLSSVIARRLS